jgi:hypothetical protein
MAVRDDVIPKARVYVEVVVPLGNTQTELSCVGLMFVEIPVTEYRNEAEIAKAMRRLADAIETYGTQFIQTTRPTRI